MPVEYPLNAYLTEGTTYKAEDKILYIIRRLGTNSSGDGYLYIQRRETFVIRKLCAPLQKQTTNLLGLLDLKGLYYAIRPRDEFKWVGDSGSKCHIIGRILELEAGEKVPADVDARYKEMTNHGYTYIKGEKDLAAGTVWAKDTEQTVLELTPTTKERYILNGVVMCDIVNRTNVGEEFAVRFYEGREELFPKISSPKRWNLDLLAFPRPPKEDVEMIPFSFEKEPIELRPDVTFKVTFHNQTGADQTVPSGVTWQLRFDAIVEYEILP